MVATDRLVSSTAELSILAVGCSVRALVGTIVRGGRACSAVDLFADRDTRTLAGLTQDVADLDQLPAVVSRIRGPSRSAAGPALIVGSGGIENRIEAIEALEQMPGVIVAGCPGSAMRLLRNPEWIGQQLKAAGWPSLPVQRQPPAVDDPRRWMIKPVKSAGGTGIRVWHGEPAQPGGPEVFFQERVDGPVYGGTMVAHRDGVQLVGVCRQLTLRSGALPLRYAGSAGPVQIPGPALRQLAGIGGCLARSAGMTGWFGIDFVIRQGEVMVLEVNPRFTASMELLDGRTLSSLWEVHWQAVTGGVPSYPAGKCQAPGRSWPAAAKAIVYHDRAEPLPVTQAGSDGLWTGRFGSGIKVADVPRPGAVIASGGPVCTVLAEADSAERATARLPEAIRAVQQNLGMQESPAIDPLNPPDGQSG